MSEVYAKKAFIQRRAPEMPRGLGLKSYEPAAGGQGVIAMLEQVAKENEDAERQTIREENDSQAGYEDFVKNTHKSIALMSKQLVDDTEVKSKEEKKEVEDKQDVRLTVKDILSLGDVSN